MLQVRVAVDQLEKLLEEVSVGFKTPLVVDPVRDGPLVKELHRKVAPCTHSTLWARS